MGGKAADVMAHQEVLEEKDLLLMLSTLESLVIQVLGQLQQGCRLLVRELARLVRLPTLTAQ